jgi:hypothetical protein
MIPEGHWGGLCMVIRGMGKKMGMRKNSEVCITFGIHEKVAVATFVLVVLG